MALLVANKRDLPEGWQQNPKYVYIGRGSPWGNPWTHLPLDKTKAQYKVSTRGEAIGAYEHWIRYRLAMREPGLRERILALDGKVACCYCRPLTCHGDALAKILQEIKDGQL
jgi:hypothetical protein